MTNILRFRNWIKSLFRRRRLPMKIGNQGDWGILPNKKIASGVHRCTACQFVKGQKSHLRKGIAVKNKVIVKDKDEWSSLANFIGNIIAKYADEIDFDSLPDPDVYLQKRYIYMNLIRRI